MYQAALTPQSRAWSLEGHQAIVRFASKLLPAEWTQFFGYYEWLLDETTTYPDIYYRKSDPQEAPRHFIDLEIMNPDSPKTGTLPQSVEEFALDMQLSLQANDWNSMFLHAGRVAHYVADAAQPYHTTVNYDPMDRTGKGLHSVLDSSLATHLSEFRVVSPSDVGQLTPVGNLTEFMFDLARESHSFLPVINKTLIDDGLDWSPELTNIIENRTNAAIVSVARVWLTAIVRANSSAPTIPTPNQLSIVIEEISLNAENSMVRLHVIDSLQVKTWADVTIIVDGRIFQGQMTGHFPPVGEYVIVLQSFRGDSFNITAQKGGYQPALLTVFLENTPTTVETANSSSSFQSERVGNMPTVTIVALTVMFVALFVLLLYRRSALGH
jgi:hypothetical protein